MIKPRTVRANPMMVKVSAASKCKHVDAASDTTLTEEVHDTGDFSKLALITIVFMMI